MIEILNELPTNIEEIEKAKDYIKDIKIDFQTKKHVFTEKDYIYLYQKTLKILYYIGELSIPAMNLCDELELEYMKLYKHSPELAKKLWLKKYKEINKPYNLLKNRCFTLLEQFEEQYIKIYKKIPTIVLDEF